ncbi:MAG: choice-of-anchor D domain-containing protein [Flavobacteriales bacterium]|nr:choice-of-anchor D domain-containing protein [Flavobacteriales bacterium]
MNSMKNSTFFQRYRFGHELQPNLKKTLTILLFAFFCISTSYGQTVLSSGDIAIIHVGVDDEDFAFVTFVNLDAGTQIYFTDEEADGDYTMGTGEGTVLYTAPAGGVLAGTVIVGNSAGSATNFSSTTDGAMTLGNSGDGIIAYQGSMDASGVGAVTTYLHGAGEDAGDMGTFPGGFSNYILFGGDNGEYTGTRIGGDASSYLVAINNSANWSTSGSSIGAPDTTSFTMAPVSEINIQGNSVDIVSGDTTPSTTDDTAFGIVPVGNFVTKTYTIQNTGSANLTLGSPAVQFTGIETQFSITQPTLSVIPGGGSTTFSVTFTPLTTIVDVVTLQINSDDSDEATYTFDISGNDDNAPTILKTGDMVLTGYSNNVGGGDDAIRVLTFVDINEGTSFKWINATYETGGNPTANIRTDKWYTCSSSPTGNVPYLEFTYNGSTEIPAGTVFCIRTVVTGTGSTIEAYANDGTYFPGTDFTITSGTADGTTGVAHGLVNVSTSGPDSMFLLQGDFIYDVNGSTFNGAVLSGVQDGGIWYDLSDDLSATTGDNLRISRRHPQLLCASMQASATPATYAGEYDTANELVVGTRPELITEILDYTNTWASGFGSCPNPSPFTINSVGDTNPWNGSFDANWFNCRNWGNLTVPDKFTNVIIDATATSDAVVNVTNQYASDFNNIAQCKDLTINGRKVQLEGNSNNKIEVYGNLEIGALGELDMSDGTNGTPDGQIYLYGNWTNNAGETEFKQGESTIHFIGSNPQVISSVDTTTTETFFNVVLDNNFTTSVSNDLIALGDLTVESSRAVVISGGDYIDITNDIVNNGTITVEDGGNLVQRNDAGLAPASTTVKSMTRPIPNHTWVHRSSPINNASADILSTYNFGNYAYDVVQSTGQYRAGQVYVLDQTGWVKQTDDSNMIPGRGFILRTTGQRFSAPAIPGINLNVNTNTAVNIETSGTANNGEILVPLHSDGNAGVVMNQDVAGGDQNLVGNPYPSAIDAYAFLTTNTDNDGIIYVWTNPQISGVWNSVTKSFNYPHSTSFAEINLLGETAANGYTPSRYIAPHQGFVIYADCGDCTGKNVTFNNSMRVTAETGGRKFARTISDDKDRAWLNLEDKQSGYVSQILVGYTDKSTKSFDRLYDGKALEEPFRLFSKLDDKKLAIQGRGIFNTEDVVELGFSSEDETDRMFEISLAKLEGKTIENVDVILKDKLLGVNHNLKESAYVFASNDKENESRFEIVYRETLDSSSVELENKDVKIAIDGTVLAIESVKEMKSIIVYNLAGQLVASFNGDNQTKLMKNVIDNSNTVYIVNIVYSDGSEITQKVK